MNIIFVSLFFCMPMCQIHASYSNEYPDVRLINAIQNNQAQEVLEILQAGTLLDCADKKNITPLMHAALAVNDNLVRLLLRYGAHIDYAPKKNHTVLADIVYLHTLFNHPFTKSDQYKHDYSAIIMTLILYGADFSRFTNNTSIALEDTLPPVHIAVLLQKEKKLQKLLVPQASWVKKLVHKLFSRTHNRKHTLDLPPHTVLIDPILVNQQALNNITPLHIAAARGSIALVNQLISAEAHTNMYDSFGNTPLHYAALNGHAEVIAALLNAGADTTSINNDGQIPLQFATSVSTQGHSSIERNTQTIRIIDVFIQAMRSHTI